MSISAGIWESHNAGRVRLLVVMGEYTRENLVIDAARSFSGQDVVELLRYLFAVRGCPAYIRSDNGPEFISMWRNG